MDRYHSHKFICTYSQGCGKINQLKAMQKRGQICDFHFEANDVPGSRKVKTGPNAGKLMDTSNIELKVMYRT